MTVVPSKGSTTAVGIRSRVRRVIALTLSTLLVAFIWNTAPAGADVTAVGGGAFGERVRVGNLITSGPLPSVTLPAAGGGPFQASLANVNLPGTLTAGLLEVKTQGAVGAAGFAESSARVLNARVGAAVVTADVISSRCRASANGLEGSATLTNARVGGLLVAANPAPNTVIALPGATVFLNEQIVTNQPGATSIVVNAVRVVLLPGILQTEVILGQSRCQATVSNVTTTTTSSTSSTTSSSTTSSSTTTTTRCSAPGPMGCGTR